MNVFIKLFILFVKIVLMFIGIIGVIGIVAHITIYVFMQGWGLI